MPLAAIVIDTNVVLDWLLFNEPSARHLATAILGQQVHWIATAQMRDELAEVLRRGLAERRGVPMQQVLAGFDTHAKILPQAGGRPGPSPAPPLCTDTDDQKFIDLACETRARWLVSRDRAVLRLSRQARSVGVRIVAPERWSLDGD